MSSLRLVLATRNRHKLLELRRILDGAALPEVEVVGADAVDGGRGPRGRGDSKTN